MKDSCEFATATGGIGKKRFFSRSCATPREFRRDRHLKGGGIGERRRDKCKVSAGHERKVSSSYVTKKFLAVSSH